MDSLKKPNKERVSMLLREYIGKALQAERKMQNRNLRNVSQYAMTSLGYLSEIERGLKEPSSEMLNAICNALYITIGDLMVDVTVAMKKDAGDYIDSIKEQELGLHTV